MCGSAEADRRHVAYHEVRDNALQPHVIVAVLGSLGHERYRLCLYRAASQRGMQGIQRL